MGYQLCFDVCEVIPAAGSNAAALTPDKRETGAVVLCSLTDRDGRRLTFQDVGTGISCVLPVLGALHAGSSFVQQPELHLHPALQAALADVAIDAANRAPWTVEQDSGTESGLKSPSRGEVRHILETHSEYILLRCLKRLRQTAQGMHPENSPQRLTPDQLAVLYFDPRPDGTTLVRRIRVTDDGEFIDRWPRGFFEERGQELFDE
jgi:predicted ATPase